MGNLIKGSVIKHQYVYTDEFIYIFVEQTNQELRVKKTEKFDSKKKILLD